MTHEPLSPRTLIHVGYHKCASKFLQRFLFPEMGRFLHVPREALDHIGKDRRFTRGRFLEQIGGIEAPGDVTVVSHEELSGHVYGHPEIDPYRLADRLRSCWEDARILLLVRNQIEYMRSIYAYRVCVRGMETRSYAEFLSEEGRRGLFEKLEYDRLVTHYRTVFSPQRVLVLPMEMLAADPTAMLRRIAAHAGTSAPTLRRPRPVNVSPRLRAAVSVHRRLNGPATAIHGMLRSFGVRRLANSFAYRYGLLQERAITPILERLLGDGARIEMPRTLSDALRSRYAASNGVLRSLVDFDPSEYGYPA
jgi:hypothetical protein